MLILDPPTLLAVAAVISSLANLIWTMRRRTTVSDPLISEPTRAALASKPVD
ncbi:hypothetical protein [Sphingomonas montana]|uniref:hypothetical protein n=1 Tax=Sphingomonas montana TaxID=1843236 RepID=UPI0013ECBD05|nr:hypothetical protein [Sphingomonas montana]